MKLARAAAVLLLASCTSGDPPTGNHSTPPANELTVAYIHRSPEIDFVEGSSNPARDGWPAVGQQVVWQAHITYFGNEFPTVQYRWLLDGAEVAKGSVTIPTEGDAVVSYAWPWTFDRHRLRLELDPGNLIREEEEGNNSLEIFTDALSMGFYVETGLYNYMRATQPRLIGAHSVSFENWAQRQISRYNDLLEKAIYPETPNGVVDRYRLDKITLVPNNSLPLNDAQAGFDPPQAVPNSLDRTVDIQWGFPVRQQSAYEDGGFNLVDFNQNYYSGFVQHETGHARYLIDVYTWDVYDGITWQRVDIVEGGQRVAGSRFMPGSQVNVNGANGLLLHHRDFDGLMADNWTFLDRYSAIMMNRIAHQRPRFGNFNEPSNVGEFLDEMPADNIVTIRDAQGNPIPDASVAIYRGGPFPGGQPATGQWVQYFDNLVDGTFTSDAAGEVHLGRNPFTASGPVQIDQRVYLRGVIIVRVESGDRAGYAFLESSEFNLAYQQGKRDAARYDLKVNMLTK
jgi:hypothetical protein